MDVPFHSNDLCIRHSSRASVIPTFGVARCADEHQDKRLDLRQMSPGIGRLLAKAMTAMVEQDATELLRERVHIPGVLPHGARTGATCVKDEG